jgi:hypothetical protein
MEQESEYNATGIDVYRKSAVCLSIAKEFG